MVGLCDKPKKYVYNAIQKGGLIEPRLYYLAMVIQLFLYNKVRAMHCIVLLHDKRTKYTQKSCEYLQRLCK